MIFIKFLKLDEQRWTDPEVVLILRTLIYLLTYFLLPLVLCLLSFIEFNTIRLYESLPIGFQMYFFSDAFCGDNFHYPQGMSRNFY